MNAFIVLHTKSSKLSDLCQKRLNIAHISAYSEHLAGALVKTIDAKSFMATESPKEIDALIERAQGTVIKGDTK